MGMFRAADGSTTYQKSKKRKLIIDGKEYVAVPRPKVKSRRDRLADAIQAIEEVKSAYEDALSALDNAEEGKPPAADEIFNNLPEIDISGVEELKDEMEGWAGNMEGTNLESTEKYEQVREVSENLDSATSSLDSISYPDSTLLEKAASGKLVVDDDNDEAESLRSEIQQVIDDIEDAVGELEGIEFPGAFGR